VGPPSGGTYHYDSLDRLTSWVPQNGGPEHRYTWDAAGNRTDEQTVAAGGSPVTVGSWTYDERNRLTSAHTVAGGQTRDSTYQYTPRGTLASVSTAGAGTTTLAFDAFDRLVSDGGVSYTYDALSRPVTRNGTGMSYAVYHDARSRDYYRMLSSGRIFWCGCPDPLPGNGSTGRTTEPVPHGRPQPGVRQIRRRPATVDRAEHPGVGRRRRHRPVRADRHADLVHGRGERATGGRRLRRGTRDRAGVRADPPVPGNPNALREAGGASVPCAGALPFQPWRRETLTAWTRPGDRGCGSR
jgi:YD repeat-containing protein